MGRGTSRREVDVLTNVYPDTCASWTDAHVSMISGR